MRPTRKPAARTARKRKAPAPRRREAKQCRHTHANFDTIWHGQHIGVMGCYAVWYGDDPNFGYGEYRQILSAQCASCGAALPLGPANNSTSAVQVEMRAAELETSPSFAFLALFGFANHEQQRDKVAAWPPADGEATDWWAGWLMREMLTHDQCVARDATARAWRIDRPLAEQLAETATDAAADAMESCPVDHGHARSIAALADGIVEAGGTLPYRNAPEASASPTAPDTGDDYGDLMAELEALDDVELARVEDDIGRMEDAARYELTRNAEPDCRDEDGPEVERIMESIDE